jgi:carbonic anhydrase
VVNSAFVGLLEGNLEHAAEVESQLAELQDGQAPEVVSVCCSDSRVMQDRMWGVDDPGRVFTCGNIGNRVVQRTTDGDVVSGDVLYPLVNTGTRTAVVVGHTGCGAVTAAYDALTNGRSDPPGIEHCLDLLKPSLEPGVEALPAGLTHAAAVDHLVEYNVDRQVEALRTSDDVPDGVTAVGVVYDLHGVYGGRAGQVYVVNVDGERTPEALREAHPELTGRIERRWTY